MERQVALVEIETLEAAAELTPAPRRRFPIASDSGRRNRLPIGV